MCRGIRREAYRIVSDTSDTLLVIIRGGVGDTRLEAKAKDKKNPRPRQRTALSRTGPLEAKDTDASVFQKKVFKNFFPRDLQKKQGLQKNFSGDLQRRKTKKVIANFPRGF